MLVAEKPPLDEALLMHYGVKGMRWGFRKPEETGSSGGRRSGSSKEKESMSPAKKRAIKIALVAGVAAGAYVIATRGQSPRTAAFSSRANRSGMRVATNVLKRVGKTSVSVVKKTATTTGKVGYKVGKTTTRLTTQAVKKVSITSSKKLVDTTIKIGSKTAEIVSKNYGKISARLAARNAPVVNAGSNAAARLLRRVGRIQAP